MCLWIFNLHKMQFRVGFPTGRDSATFRDKGTDVPSLSRDKGTTGQAQNLAKGRNGPRQPVKIRDRTQDGTVPDFDSLSSPFSWDKTGQRRKGHSKTGKRRFKTENDVLKQEKMF